MTLPKITQGTIDSLVADLSDKNLGDFNPAKFIALIKEENPKLAEAIARLSPDVETAYNMACICELISRQIDSGNMSSLLD